MSIIPELQIGLLNAWIPALPLWTIGWLFLIFTNRNTAKRLVDRDWYNKKEKTIGTVFMSSYYLMVFTTFLIPFKNSNSILFFVGIIIYLVGIIPLISAYYTYAKTPVDKPISKGIYKYSRNPMYFFATICFFGIFISTTSLLFLIFFLICTTFQHFLILAEERYCINEYKQEYKDYMKKVPRYFLFF